MAYNTGNPPGSTSPKDLIDNAEDLDFLMTGSGVSHPNRLGVPLKSWKGMEGEHDADQIRREAEFDAEQIRHESEFDIAQGDRVVQFNTFMDASGYEPPIPYAPGILLDRTTKTVSYLGNEYRARGSLIPFTTSNWATDEAKLKLIGDDSLRQDMAINGAAINTYVPPVGPSISVKGFLDRQGVWAGAANELQPALDFLRAEAEARGDTYGRTKVQTPGKRYTLTSSLIMKPWQQLESTGALLLDFSDAAANVTGIICDNFTSIPIDALKWSGNGVSFLGSPDGPVGIKGPGVTSTASGMKLGNFSAGGQPFRDVKNSNIVISGFKNAQEFGNYDTYLYSCKDFRFEGSETCIKTQVGTGFNSGERMTWFNGVFAGANTAAIDHNIDVFDIVLDTISFDFNGTILKLGANSRYHSTRFVTPYLEAFGGYIVDGTAAPGDNLDVFVSKMIVLPRDRIGGKAMNSPSRKLFKGNFNLTIDGVKPRYETRPYLEDGVMIDSSVTVIKAGGIHPSQYNGPLHLGQIFNTDNNFQRDASGTDGDALSSWQRNPGNTVNVLTRNLTTLTVDGLPKKVLQLVGSSGTGTSTITWESKQTFPVVAGDIFYTSMCISLLANPSGNVQGFTYMEFFDNNGVSVGLSPAFRQYIYRAAFDDATVPNFAQGNARWMDSTAFKSVAPMNAVSAKMRFQVANFDGTVYVSRARCWRA